jgi:hypothetical protein
MTRYAKLAISLPLRAAEHVRRAVKAGKADSVSSYIARAIEERAKSDDGDLFEELLAETGGPLTEAEKRMVDRELAAGARSWGRARPPVGPKSRRRRR